MSLATLAPAGISTAQAAISSAAIVKNILAGFTPSLAGLDAITQQNREIGGFEFDYAGERRLEAGTDVTDHFNESKKFFNDHIAVRPTHLVLRGFVSETSFKKNALVPSLLALASALAPVGPYLGTYAPGAAAKMAAAVSQSDQIINQLAQIQSLYGSVTKLVSSLPQKTKVQQAYDKLDAMRVGGVPFAVVTPWATFGDLPENGHGLMTIENLVLIEPEETSTLNDIVVTLKEMRVAPSVAAVTQDNARGSQIPAINGAISEGVLV